MEATQKFDVRRILEALKTGQPIGGEAGSLLLSPRYKRAIAPIIKSVHEAQQNGPVGMREVFWVSGQPGNGKTQTLRQLIHEIRSRQGSSKFAFVFIDLDQKPEARNGDSLTPTIVRSTLSSKVVDEVERISSKINEANPTTDESLSVGIDVIAELAQVPALNLFLKHSVPRIMQFFRSREIFIKNTLRKKWGNYPELLELLSSWLKYTLKPTPKLSEDFDSTLKELASHGVLFTLYEFALRKAQFTSLVLILDEVENVTIDSLKPIWDPRWHPNEIEASQGMNLIFVLSAQDQVMEEVSNDAALYRRFFNTQNGNIQLLGPEVRDHGNDDIEHIVFTLDKLLSEYPEYRKKTETALEDVIIELRSEFRNRSATWQELWRAAIEKMTDL